MHTISAETNIELQPSKLHVKLVTLLISWFFVKALVVLIFAALAIAFSSRVLFDANKSLDQLTTIIILANVFAVVKIAVDIQEKYYTAVVGNPAELIAGNNSFPQLYSELHATLFKLAGSCGTFMLRSALHHLQEERHLDLTNAREETFQLIMEQSLIGLVHFESKGTTPNIFDSFRPSIRTARLPQLAQKYISLYYSHLILTNPTVFNEQYLNEIHPGLAALVSTMTSLDYTHDEIISSARVLAESTVGRSHDVDVLPDNFV